MTMKNNDDLQKTISMKQWFNQTVLTYQNIDYLVATFDVDFAKTHYKYFASVGADKSPWREICIFDATKVVLPFIQQGLVDKHRPNEHKVRTITKAIADFPQKEDLINQLWDFVEQYKKTDPSLPPIIPMQELKDNQLMVCRHLALYLAASLGNLIQTGLLNQGTVHQYRDILTKDKGSIEEGGHTWVLYHDQVDKKLYLLDPMWKFALNLFDQNDLDTAKQLYGEKVLETMLTRALEHEQKPTTNKEQISQPMSINRVHNIFDEQPINQTPKIKAPKRIIVRTPLARKNCIDINYTPPVQNQQSEELDFYAFVEPSAKLDAPNGNQNEQTPKEMAPYSKPKPEKENMFKKIGRKLF